MEKLTFIAPIGSDNTSGIALIVSSAIIRVSSQSSQFVLGVFTKIIIGQFSCRKDLDVLTGATIWPDAITLAISIKRKRTIHWHSLAMDASIVKLAENFISFIVSETTG
jgi:hypothetical protein